SPAYHSILEEMETLGTILNFPIVGPLVGRSLYILTRLSNPIRILELGSGYGYSAFWFALASGPETKIICTENSQENIDRAQDFLGRAGLWDKIEYHRGDALQTLRKENGEFDILFMDIDKQQYPDGFRNGFPK